MDTPRALSYSGDLDLAEISKRGELIDVHNRVRMVTVGIASTSPILPLPNVMLLARPAAYIEAQPPPQASSKSKMRNPHPSKTLELTRLLPLKFVKISVHDREKQQLRLKLASGRSFYLQLCPPSDAREDLFSYWEKLIYLLRPPVEGYSSTHAIPAGDGVEVPVFMSKEKSPEPILHSEDEQDKVSIKSLHMMPDIPGQDETAAAAGEGFPSPGGTEKDLMTHHYTIQGVPSMSPPSTPSVPSIAVAAAASRGPASKAMAGGSPGMGAATAGGQGPGVSVALAGTATGQVTETISAGSVSLVLAGAASMSPDSVSMASAGTGSRTPSGHVSMASAGAGSIAVAGIGTIMPLGPESPLVSTLQSEGYMSERDGSQRVTMANPKASKEGRSARRHSRHREGRARKGAEKDGSSGHRRSSRRAVTSKETPKSSHRPRGSRHSPPSRKATSPSVKDSRTSHKPGKSKSSASAPLPAAAPTKKPSRIASFLRSFSRSSQSTKSTSVLTNVGDTAETSKASVTEIDMSTILENVESTEIEMETITQMLLPPAAEEDKEEQQLELVSLLMDSVGDSQGPAPTLLPSPESQH
ncbi:protein FAM71A-like isoform X2 [Trichosurus vulpecula]|uniref:protein FAM71A-like isoform X2 n=1 Tax=Trichosurus vulpecula TaxID=9337 RepID=UPI00186B4803|nr:protein FAM71A-like isoform X2 [Trichosurus vulpecula]